MQNILESLIKGAWDFDQVPALVGPSQTGKTLMVKRLAEELNMPLIIINPSLDLPEEIGGYPRHTEGKQLSYIKPAWFPNKPSIIFVDELDKAKEETVVAFLTAFKESRVRDWSFPEGTKLVVAMNPPKRPLPEALIERLMFLPFGDNWHWLTSSIKNFSWLKNVVDEIKDREFSVPEHEASPGAMDQLQKWFIKEEFWKEPYQELIIKGWVPRSHYKLIQKAVNNAFIRDYAILAEKPEMWAKFLQEAREEEIFDAIPHVIAQTKRAKVWTTLFEWTLNPEEADCLSLKRYEVTRKALARLLDLGYDHVDAEAFQEFLKHFNGSNNAIIYRMNRGLWNHYVKSGLLKKPLIPITVPDGFDFSILNK